MLCMILPVRIEWVGEVCGWAVLSIDLPYTPGNHSLHVICKNLVYAQLANYMGVPGYAVNIPIYYGDHATLYKCMQGQSRVAFAYHVELKKNKVCKSVKRSYHVIPLRVINFICCHSMIWHSASRCITPRSTVKIGCIQSSMCIHLWVFIDVGGEGVLACLRVPSLFNDCWSSLSTLRNQLL